MADYSITFARTARKELENLRPHDADRVLKKIELLGENPRLPGTIKLHGVKNLWRLRLGDYRVIYSINDSAKTIDVSLIRHRRDVYQDF
jgi:mRNA interferase RelE/StbE